MLLNPKKSTPPAGMGIPPYTGRLFLRLRIMTDCDRFHVLFTVRQVGVTSDRHVFRRYIDRIMHK